MKVEAVVEVRYTEDREKVLKALENVFTPCRCRRNPAKPALS